MSNRFSLPDLGIGIGLRRVHYGDILAQKPPLDWFEVLTIRGHLDDGRVQHYQVTLKVGFRLDE